MTVNLAPGGVCLHPGQKNMPGSGSGSRSAEWEAVPGSWGPVRPRSDELFVGANIYSLISEFLVCCSKSCPVCNAVGRSRGNVMGLLLSKVENSPISRGVRELCSYLRYSKHNVSLLVGSFQGIGWGFEAGEQNGRAGMADSSVHRSKVS